ncbi:unnamed protein product (macronuclear) [Paramecium tetraurelia]|uniref:Flagellar FliJ protein n=1 Tax=Paramecium tetraurelia TaxID=5888 RepID=A0DUQ5_PARTE|nr:uncharacterized protein GSPATT00020444001 [Paramecium tetraurelia]CAK86772.1 unnamed protein product [Paramecium tetraurelia]|eukprot:XP_001454169.1 hypothetical protein (macronuclear) [Paramecium tetraurelia strain d4-2]
MFRKKEVIQIAELRAEPLKDIQFQLSEELYESKFIYNINRMQWKLKREVIGDVQKVSEINSKISIIKESHKSQLKEELVKLTQDVVNLEQQKVNQIKTIRKLVDDKEFAEKKSKEMKKLFLQSQIRNEQLKKMILEEEERFKSLILN